MPSETEIQEANAKKGRLDALCISPALKIASEKLKADDPFDRVKAEILWQTAAREIPRIHGEYGRQAVHFMEMMAYMGDDKYEFVKPRQELIPNQPPTLDYYKIINILCSWGLLATSRDGNSNLSFDGHPRFASGIIYFHSTTLMEAIGRVNGSREENLLKDLLSQRGYLRFSRINFYTIWSLAYEYKDIFDNYFSPYEFQYAPMNVMEMLLFDNILETYKQPEVQGKVEVAIVYVKALVMNQALEFECDFIGQLGLEDIWEMWTDADGYRSCFEEFMKTRRWLEPAETMYCVRAFQKIAKSIFALVKSPRPRPEYEELFLKEGFEFVERLVQYANGHVDEFLQIIVPFANELTATGRISLLIRSYTSSACGRNLTPQGFKLLGWEKAMLEMYLKLATLPTIDSWTRNSILSELLILTENLYQNMLRIFRKLETQFQPYLSPLEDLLPAVLSHIKCLEGLGKHCEVIQIIVESRVLHINLLNQLPWMVYGEAKACILEIKAIESQCENVIVEQGKAHVQGIRKY